MTVISVDVRPKRLADDSWTLYEFTITDEIVNTRHGRINRGTRRVWPEAKQENGRGKKFPTQKKAMLFFLEFKEDFSIAKGSLLQKRLKRMKLI